MRPGEPADLVAPPGAGRRALGRPGLGRRRHRARAPPRRARAGPPPDRAADDPERERERLDEALAAAREAIARDREAVAGRAGDAEAAIFDAHLALLDDEALLEPAHEAIAGGATAERAWHDAAEQVGRALPRRSTSRCCASAPPTCSTWAAGSSPPSRARRRAGPTEPGIVLAGELTPAEAAGLDPALVRGIATAHGSATAHAAILARALGLPAAVGLGDALLAIDEGTPLLLDGEAGTLEVDPGDGRAARRRGPRRARSPRAARPRASAPTSPAPRATARAWRSSPTSAPPPRRPPRCELGAEGVGLLRTEFLFLDRAQLPDEDEQAETLRQIAVALDGRPLVVRTLDAGADKPLPALPMPPEANPFLGVRGIRLALERPEILATQLRAILRVAAEHPVKAMLPMVATLAEVRAARALLDEARPPPASTRRSSSGSWSRSRPPR